MNTSPRPHRFAALALAGATTVAVAVPATAAAGSTADLPRTYVEQWQDSIDENIADGDPGFCGDLGFDVRHTMEASGSFVGTRRGDQLWYFGDRFRGTETFSNPETGHVFRRDFAGTDRDQTIVDNGDGSLSITVQLTGPSRYSLDGSMLFMDTGLARFSLLVDDGGTPGDPSDDGEAQFVSLDTVTGLRQTDGRDFCADIAEFLG